MVEMCEESNLSRQNRIYSTGKLVVYIRTADKLVRADAQYSVWYLGSSGDTEKDYNYEV